MPISIGFAQHYKKTNCSSILCLETFTASLISSTYSPIQLSVSLLNNIDNLLSSSPLSALGDDFPKSSPIGSRKRPGRYPVTAYHPFVVPSRLILNRAGGLPKKTETCYFFRIESAHVSEFRTRLSKLVPLITTTTQTVNDQRKQIAQAKKDAAEKKYAPPLLKMSGVNISFSHKGLQKVSPAIWLIRK